MFVSGRIRGNARQLADYLLTKGENERIFVLDVDGRSQPNDDHLKSVLLGMELNSELTRSRNSVYHAVLRPDPESQKDRALTMEEWHQAVEMLAEELPFEHQRRATVLHEKDGYFHAHVVFERYDHEKGTMIDYKHNYEAHDRARHKLERHFGHALTPQKNPNRANHKKALSDLWRDSKSGAEFITKAKEQGYSFAKGTSRPYKVIDQNGRSFDLARQLDGIKTKEIREQLSDVNLATEKNVMKQSRKDKNILKLKDNTSTITKNQMDMSRLIKRQIDDMYRQHLKGEFLDNKDYVIVPASTNYEELKKEAAYNSVQITQDATEKFLEEMREASRLRKERDHGREIG